MVQQKSVRSVGDPGSNRESCSLQPFVGFYAVAFFEPSLIRERSLSTLLSRNRGPTAHLIRPCMLALPPMCAAFTDTAENDPLRNGYRSSDLFLS